MVAYTQSADPGFVTEEIPQAAVRFTASSPPTAATMQRGKDCQFRAQISSIRKNGTWEPSQQTIMVFADSSETMTGTETAKTARPAANPCSVIESAAYSAIGSLSPSRFGNIPIWLGLDSTSAESFHQTAAPTPIRAAIAHMRKAFLAQCRNLDEQGRILVPGVTMGVLGQETLLTGASDDETAGKKTQENFKKSGIVHLLAVSGGHFVLLGELLRRLMGRCHLPRMPTAGVVASGYVALSVLMYPSDSVSRALIMGLLALGAMLVGRRPRR
jgi:competence protein ComEC